MKQEHAAEGALPGGRGAAPPLGRSGARHDETPHTLAAIATPAREPKGALVKRSDSLHNAQTEQRRALFPKANSKR